jgi:glutathione S-transferase
MELFQTEWCPASRRVRQRLTELGLDVVLHQVPVEREERTALVAATGSDSIPVLVDGSAVAVGEEEILDHLGSYPEPAEAASQRAKAARARARELEDACMELAATP